MPNAHSLLIGIEKYMFGTKFTPPASPPLLPSGWFAAAADASLLNLIEGVMMCSAPAICLVLNCDSAAGFHHMAVTSSVNAAPAASALPIELALFSFSWKPVANDWVAAKASIDPATAAATRLRRKWGWFMDSPLVVLRF